MHSEPIEDAPSTYKQRRRQARRMRRVRDRAAAAPDQASTVKRSLLQQVIDILVHVERGARDLRDVAQSAASALELGRTQLIEQQEAAVAWTRRAARVHETGAMLLQLVLGYRLFGLRTAFASAARKEELRAQLHQSNAARFTQVSLEQGGAFLKVGQLLSARADLLPSVWVRELSVLQDAAPPIPDDEARRALETALGAPPEELFAEFDFAPLAAASIGQVHRARTLDGHEVAVKLRRPGIAASIEDDLALLDITVDALRRSLPPLDLDTILREIREYVRAEVEYAREAVFAQRAAHFFADVPGMIAPEPVLALCCDEVLTTRFVHGRKISVVLDELVAARDTGDRDGQARISELLGRLLQAYLRQILELGSFQADPHPGNLLVTPEDELVILDFGCAAELSDEIRLGYLSLLSALFERDTERLADTFERLGFRTQSGRADTLVSFTNALLGELAEAVQAGTVHWPDRAALAARAKELGRLLTADPVVIVPGHFVMIGRVLATLGGLFSHYRPDLDVTVHVLPVLASALMADTRNVSA